MNFGDLKIGMKAQVTKTITEADVILYAGITLDINPAHLNEEHAKKTIFCVWGLCFFACFSYIYPFILLMIKCLMLSG